MYGKETISWGKTRNIFCVCGSNMYISIYIYGLYKYYSLFDRLKRFQTWWKQLTVGCNPILPEICPSYRYPFQPLEIDPGKLCTGTILFWHWHLEFKTQKNPLMREEHGEIWSNLQESGIHFIPSHPKWHPTCSWSPVPFSSTKLSSNPKSLPRDGPEMHLEKIISWKSRAMPRKCRPCSDETSKNWI